MRLCRSRINWKQDLPAVHLPSIGPREINLPAYYFFFFIFFLVSKVIGNQLSATRGDGQGLYGRFVVGQKGRLMELGVLDLFSLDVR